MRTISLMVFFLIALSLNARANPYYESIHCIDESSNEIGEEKISQCLTTSSEQYLCPIGAVECDKNDNFDSEPPECNEPKQFDSGAGVCSETLVNNAQCPTGSVLSNNRCDGLLTQNASCPSGQSLKDDMCSATLNQTAGCPSGQTLQNDICTATLTKPVKCPSGQSFNSSTGRCSKTIYSSAQCPSGSSLSNDRCNGLLVQNAACPSGQTLKDGMCSTTLTSAAQCRQGGRLQAGKCQGIDTFPFGCKSGYELQGVQCISKDEECRGPTHGNKCTWTSGGSFPTSSYYWNGERIEGVWAALQLGLSCQRPGTQVGEFECTNLSNPRPRKCQIYESAICHRPVESPCNAIDGFVMGGGNQGLCGKHYSEPPICQRGYGYNIETNKCEKTINTAPMCNAGYSFNISTNKCEKRLNTLPLCRAGYTYSPTHDKCLKIIKSSPFCQSDYTYNSNRKLCTKVVSSSPLCPSNYSYNVTTDRCEKTITSNPMCNTGYHYNVVTNRCEQEIDTDPICPTGYGFNPKTDKCEKVITDVPQCSSGYGYNPETKQCEKSWVTESCRYGSQFQCIPHGGSSFCSPNQCFDPNTEKVEEDDNIDGSMLLDNGEVNDEGLCLDQVYIFNGRAQKCRTKGVQTAFQDCCESDGKALKDGGGSKAQSEMTSASINAIYQASAAAYAAYNAGATMAEVGNAFSSGFVGAFDPTSLAVSLAIAVVMDYLAKACDQIETETALANSSSMCVYVGKYCKEKWLGKCVQKAKSYCCFNSQLAKIINEQGRLQLKSFENIGNRGFGEVKNPQCRGFTPEEFQALDFSNIDLSDYYDEITHRAQSEVQETMESMTEEYFNNVN